MTIFGYEKPPKTMEETGLSQSFLIGLTCKIMYEGGAMTPSSVSKAIKLPNIVCRQILLEMVSLSLIEAQGLESEDIKSEIRYSLSDAGRRWALQAMLASRYIGPAPVTFDAFCRQIEKQSIIHEEIQSDTLENALRHLVIPSGMMDQLGPAANSARSVLLYGEPGNGKTSIAEALENTFQDTIFVPYAIIVGNQLIRFFDETLHELAELPEDVDRPDPRWVPCRRPVITSGGELTLNMLDLAFETTSRFYEAPMHLKALGGVFVLDDFGRQVSKPQEFLNRWILPLEKGYDILSLHTGKKFKVPFDQLVVFSSNLRPEQLGDGAALRRIYFKIHVPSPTREDYLKIFSDVCENDGVVFDREVLEAFFEREYEREDIVTSGAHPGFLLQHVKAICRYHQRKMELTDDLLQVAWKNVVKYKRSETMET